MPSDCNRPLQLPEPQGFLRYGDSAESGKSEKDAGLAPRVNSLCLRDWVMKQRRYDESLEQS